MLAAAALVVLVVAVVVVTIVAVVVVVVTIVAIVAVALALAEEPGKPAALAGLAARPARLREWSSPPEVGSWARAGQEQGFVARAPTLPGLPSYCLAGRESRARPRGLARKE